MDRRRLTVALIGAGSAFGAVGVAFASMGAGVPFLVAALAASAGAGLLHWAIQGSAAPAPPANPVQPGTAALDAQAAKLRHDLRGALSPALMVSDRLVDNPDPAVSRAGAAVVRSIERATELLASTSPGEPPKAPKA